MAARRLRTQGREDHQAINAAAIAGDGLGRIDEITQAHGSHCASYREFGSHPAYVAMLAASARGAG